MYYLFLDYLMISVFLNLIMFGLAYLFQTDKLTDVSYSLTFILLTVSSYALAEKKDVVDLFVLLLIVLWALRLGLFLLKRIFKMGRDDRFDHIRSSLKSFIGFWFMQGVSVAIICIPIFLIIQVQEKSINAIFIFGLSIALFGLIIESIADHQKCSFKEKHPSMFIQTGLWKKIRHPNYLEEILFWTGIFICSVGYLNGISIFLAALGPIWITFLLLKFSGIPPLEKKWKTVYSNNQKFKEYYSQSWRLIPYVY